MSTAKFLTLLVAFMMPGCVGTRGGGSLAPHDVTTAPTKWDGRTVGVSGILGFGSHERCVCRRGQWVTVTGVVVADVSKDADGNDIADFGRCSRVGLLVGLIE